MFEMIPIHFIVERILRLLEIKGMMLAKMIELLAVMTELLAKIAKLLARRKLFAMKYLLVEMTELLSFFFS